jgi:hypothetical protein
MYVFRNRGEFAGEHIYITKLKPQYYKSLLHGMWRAQTKDQFIHFTLTTFKKRFGFTIKAGKCYKVRITLGSSL